MFLACNLILCLPFFKFFFGSVGRKVNPRFLSALSCFKHNRHTSSVCNKVDSYVFYLHTWRYFSLTFLNTSVYSAKENRVMKTQKNRNTLVNKSCAACFFLSATIALHPHKFHWLQAGFCRCGLKSLREARENQAFCLVLSHHQLFSSKIMWHFSFNYAV